MGNNQKSAVKNDNAKLKVTKKSDELVLTIGQIKILDAELKQSLSRIKGISARTAYHLGRLQDAVDSVIKHTVKLEKEIFENLASEGKDEYKGQRVVTGENMKKYNEQITELNETVEKVRCAEFKLEDLEVLDENKRLVSAVSPIILNLLNDVLIISG